jgi:hypothetical protein
MCTERITVVVTVAVLVVAVAGCSMSAPRHSFTIAYEEQTVDNGPVRAQIEVAVGVGAEDRATWENLSLVYYDDQREIIGRKPIGNLSNEDGGDTTTVNVSFDRRPKYIVVTSPDFWTNGVDIVVDSLVYRDGLYSTYSRTSKNQTFPDDE